MLRELYLSLLLSAGSALALGQAPSIQKIDPPEWWANMPAPMLLLRGDHLKGATFNISNGLTVRNTYISENGHWAELWLAKDPQQPLTVKISAATSHGSTSAEFEFHPRKLQSAGFAGFSSRDVMYLIMTDRFADGDLSNDGLDAKQNANTHVAEQQRSSSRGWHGGDFRGILDHLDYLQSLGITTIWITPPYQNREAESYHGYGATDMYAVDDHFGSMTDLQALADGLHRRGMKLVLDTVPNHVGPEHPWVQDEPQPNWFHGTAAHHRASTGVFPQLMNPSASERDRRDVLDGWFVNLLPDMNQEDPAVSKYLIQNAIWWIERTGADGLRIDTFPYVPRQFWHDFHTQLKSLYPNVTDVGEVFDGRIALPPAMNAFFTGGVTQIGQIHIVDTGLYTPFDYPFYAVIRNVLLRGAPISELALLFSQDTLYPHPERLVTLIGSHDTKRFLSEDHADLAKLKLAFGLMLTVRGMPLIYSGDEIAMRGGDDPDNRHDFPGGFPEAQQNAFSKTTRTTDQAAIYDFVEELAMVRQQNPALTSADQQVLFSSEDVIVFSRTGGHEKVLVAVNRATSDSDVQFQTADTEVSGSKRAASLFGAGTCSFTEDKAALHLPAQSVYIARIE